MNKKYFFFFLLFEHMKNIISKYFKTVNNSMVQLNYVYEGILILKIRNLNYEENPYQITISLHIWYHRNLSFTEIKWSHFDL